MGDYELGAIQTEFAELIWEREPVSSGELVKLCSEQFEWKKSTTYTVLRKLCEKGIMKNEDGVVTSIVSGKPFMLQRADSSWKRHFRVPFRHLSQRLLPERSCRKKKWMRYNR